MTERRARRAPAPRRPSLLQLLRYELVVLQPRHGLLLAGSAAGLLLSVVSALTGAAGTPAASVVLGVVSIAISVWTLADPLFARARLHVVDATGLPVEADAITLDERLAPADARIVAIPHRGDAVERSLAVDRWLRAGSSTALVVDQRRGQRVVERLRQEAALNQRLLRAVFEDSRRNDRQFSDDAKCCLDSDLLPGTTTAIVWRGSYFGSFLTNERCRRSFFPQDEARPKAVSDATSVFLADAVDQSGRLIPLSESRLTNQIGISTLAVTSDGWLALWRQGPRAMHARGLRVPTGSGSVDWSDFRPGMSLEDTVIAAMERECLEESTAKGAALNRGHIVGTRIVGYYRWVGRGGLPEFCGLTRLGVPYRALDPNISEVDDPEGLVTRWPAASTADLRQSADALLGQTDVSLPLAVCLMALLDALDDDPAWVADALHLAE